MQRATRRYRDINVSYNQLTSRFFGVKPISGYGTEHSLHSSLVQVTPHSTSPVPSQLSSIRSTSSQAPSQHEAPAAVAEHIARRLQAEVEHLVQSNLGGTGYKMCHLLSIKVQPWCH